MPARYWKRPGQRSSAPNRGNRDLESLVEAIAGYVCIRGMDYVDLRDWRDGIPADFADVFRRQFNLPVPVAPVVLNILEQLGIEVHSHPWGSFAEWNYSDVTGRYRVDQGSSGLRGTRELLHELYEILWLRLLGRYVDWAEFSRRVGDPDPHDIADQFAFHTIFPALDTRHRANECGMDVWEICRFYQETATWAFMAITRRARPGYPFVHFILNRRPASRQPPMEFGGTLSVHIKDQAGVGFRRGGLCMVGQANDGRFRARVLRDAFEERGELGVWQSRQMMRSRSDIQLAREWIDAAFSEPCFAATTTRLGSDELGQPVGIVSRQDPRCRFRLHAVIVPANCLDRVHVAQQIADNPVSVKP